MTHIVEPDDRSEGVVPGTDGLQAGPVASADLERHVVDALRSEGLIRRPPSWSRPMVLAASIALFAVGAAAGRLAWLPVSTSSTASARYLLLLTGETEPAADPDARAAEYAAWAASLSERGIGVTGDELSNQVDHVGAVPAAQLATLSSVAGYFVLSADSDTIAAELARQCPHVKYGGAVVVRRIESR